MDQVGTQVHGKREHQPNRELYARHVFVVFEPVLIHVGNEDRQRRR